MFALEVPPIPNANSSDLIWVVLSLVVAALGTMAVGLPQLFSYMRKRQARALVEWQQHDALFGHPADPKNRIPAEDGLIGHVEQLMLSYESLDRRVTDLERILDRRRRPRSEEVP